MWLALQSSFDRNCRAGAMCPAAFDWKPSSDLRRGRYPRRPAVRPEYSFQSRRGAASPAPCDRRNSSYILECERQRRRKQVDTKLRPRPIDNPLADRKGSQETIRFPALLWGPSVRTESTPPETWTSLFHHQSPKNRQICRISRSTSASACGVSTSASSRASTSSSISSSSC